MQRFDRILGILLFLRSQRSVTASKLAQQFGVSTRTIYRDIETLSASGVPVYAERGHEGGFQLLEGYFLPPLMFSRDEAISLLLALTLMRRLHTYPFPAAIVQAERKILAALPDVLRSVLNDAEKIIGFEELPHDIFHPEPQPATEAASDQQGRDAENGIISAFLQAILEGCTVSIHYQSPYRERDHVFPAQPQGLFWDRNHWYLAGTQLDGALVPRIWRADRVIRIIRQSIAVSEKAGFDVGDLLGRRWLRPAMERWRERAPVKIRLTTALAERLQQDWYYRHACFEPLADNEMLMTFGEYDPAIVLELLRWLGAGAELLEPRAWREMIKTELQTMLKAYDEF
jgi:predicted DNA-binding transcriptional regulator YafY